VASVGVGEPLTIALAYTSQVDGIRPDDLRLHIRLNDLLGHPVTTFSTRFSPLPALGTLARTGALACHISSLTLAESTYVIDVWIDYKGVLSDFVLRAAELHMRPSTYLATGYLPNRQWHGAALIQHTWSVDAGAVLDCPLDSAMARVADGGQ
jgi:hypothetical protein